MKIQGEYRFAAPRALVWQALLDPAVLARTLPGCESLERTGADSFRGALTVHIGPVKGQFQGTLDLSDLRPLEGYHMKVAGNGGAGFMQGEGDLKLRDDAEATILTYDIDAQVGGKVAGVGQRLLDSSAKVITRQGLEGLGRQLQFLVQSAAAASESSAASESNTASDPGAAIVSSAPPAPTALPAPPSAPSQAAMAAQFASGLVGELVPKRHRRWIALAALAVVVAIAVLCWRSCGV